MIAPLGIVIDHSTEDIINLGNCIPLISDPSTFDEFHSNWNAARFELSKCELRVVKLDNDFDDYMLAFLEDGMQPILNPLFNDKAELVKGY